MIPANELRINNWVNVPHGNAQIAELRSTSVHLKDGCGSVYAHLEPIPLTPELLVKCGFMNEDLRDFGIWIVFKITTQDLWLSWNEDSIWIGEYDTKCKYLHQLQNLIFTLTQTELSITL